MMKKIYILLLFSLSIPLAVADGLPELGDSSGTSLSAVDEQKIAEQILKDVYSSDDGSVVQDPEVQDYVSQLGNKLGLASPDPQQKFYFFVVRDKTINAFAMPGGVIGVHTGLILAANEEAQVAGVLGHEIGHVVQHHMARMMAQRKTDTVFNIAGIALALLAARSNAQLGMGSFVAASAGSMQRQLDYTRDHEREADRVGIQILENAGYDTHGMSSFFEIMQKGTRFSEGSAPSFLRTHPLTSERIADVKNRESEANYRMMPYTPDFDYVRCKLIASLDSPLRAVEVFQYNLREKKYVNEASQHLGLAYAYLRKQDSASATQELNWLRANAPAHSMFEVLAANIALAQKDNVKIAQQYESALSVYPSNRSLINGYAEYLLTQNRAADMLKFVEDKQHFYPDDAYLYELKSRAYTVLGKNLMRHFAQGEANVRRYNMQGALEQFDLAAKSGDGDFYQQSMAEARLNYLKQIAVDPKKDKK